MIAARSTLFLAAAFVLCGAAFDSPSLYVPGVALAALVGGSRVWVELAARSVRVEQLPGSWSMVEGEPYELRVSVRSGRLPLPGARVVHPLADRPLPVGMCPARSVRLELGSMRRGRRRLEPAVLALNDPGADTDSQPEASAGCWVPTRPGRATWVTAQSWSDGTLGITRYREDWRFEDMRS